MAMFYVTLYYHPSSAVLVTNYGTWYSAVSMPSGTHNDDIMLEWLTSYICVSLFGLWFVECLRAQRCMYSRNNRQIHDIAHACGYPDSFFALFCRLWINWGTPLPALNITIKTYVTLRERDPLCARARADILLYLQWRGNSNVMSVHAHRS